ncbi:hypothetical protein KDN34_07405 [Shewanella yunxiaonensis]|uniref:Uncharacterized protein n=1 Tax=Shewanella yunxiaonensis TaxID=2829809 RepID=A0ABX7YYV6_9GAMM|nr:MULTISPECIES: hypothetical protein [Shewanella]MDF0534850.1 hypothetical protein [Shewanella sp. A32]QUN07241.1 hypothetical protein KDN34_07405 [Shewanella yunxiaonensis]
MAEEPKKQLRPDTDTLGIMMQHFTHLDGVMWNRVQWLIAIQTAAIGGSYALKADPHNSGFVLCLCAFVTIILLLMMRRDEVIRDANLPLLRTLHPDFTFSPKWSKGAPLKGRQLNNILFFSFLFMDLFGAFIYFFIPAWIK